MPGLLRDLPASYSQKSCKVSTKMDIKIQINILRLREVTLVAQDHTLMNGEQRFQCTFEVTESIQPHAH